ncbi:MFS transporter [Actinophytocola oryzae]|uniref:EmrB/QacA subfamily drug resistance transporter n=1 Tax=Actinophytocola oryzae TaxID=502181 RepID=A0A4R7W0D0_9PSEU|nr:MFS transporter [Actinophytocola oryzae]TDV55953.1 EmrB/QacA subfamily drug resistance transporter [Actinophytocola oryzae]
MTTRRTPSSTSATPPPAVAGNRDGLLLLALSLGYFLVMLDTTIITVALPAIGDDLSGGLSSLQWVSNGYTVTFAALLLTAGALSDKFGGRRVFLIGLWSFAALSAISAAATSMGMLIALRAVLGLAGALLVPTSLALIANTHADPSARARALGVWAALSGSGLVAGPIAGGLLTDAFGWRAIFVVNVPVALVCVWITTRRAPETARRPGRGIDLTGQVAAVVALGGLAFGLIQSGPLGWDDQQVLVALGLFVVGAVVFVAAERRPATENGGPVLPGGLFRGPVFAAGLVAGAVANFGLTGVLFVLSLSFQDTHGFSPSVTGLALLPLTVPTAFNPILTGRLVARIGVRVPATLGFVMMAVGTLAQVLFAGNSPGEVVIAVVGLLVLGFGVSFAIPSLLAAVVGSVPTELAGVGSGALNSARQTGAVLGVAVLGALLSDGDAHTGGARFALVVAGVVLLVGAAVVGTFLGRGS